MRRVAPTNYPAIEDWAEFMAARSQHQTLQDQYRTTARESEHLDRTRDQAVALDQAAYAQALIDGEGDPGQPNTLEHDQAAAAKRRHVEALAEAIHRTEVSIRDLVVSDGTTHLAALREAVDTDREKARRTLRNLVTQVGVLQARQGVAAWLQKALRGTEANFQSATGAVGRIPGLKAQNGEDHMTVTVLEALLASLEPPAHARVLQPGENVPPGEQNWGEASNALVSVRRVARDAL